MRFLVVSARTAATDAAPAGETSAIVGRGTEGLRRSQDMRGGPGKNFMGHDVASRAAASTSRASRATSPGRAER